MPNTTNFNFPTPADTDLVKDGASAIRSLGNSIDTAFVDLKGGTTGQVLSKASNTDMDFTWVAQDDSNAIQNALLTTTGDTIYASGASTPARLGIGSTGQVLTVSGGLPVWATPGGSGANWSLLNSGGTALTGAQTVTVSGISSKDKIMILVAGASSANASSIISIRLNTDTGNNYYAFGNFYFARAMYSAADIFLANTGPAQDRVRIGILGDGSTDEVGAYMLLTGANASGVKTFQYSGGVNSGGHSQYSYNGGGYYNSSSTISSISIHSSSGNLDAGTVYVYTSA